MIFMVKTTAGIEIPDSKLATEAADILREYGNEFLWNHSHRVFLFGSLLGRQENLKYDPELLYISALFHDLGLTKHYSSPDKRFEVDGANAARSLLEQLDNWLERVSTSKIRELQGFVAGVEREVRFIFSWRSFLGKNLSRSQQK